MIQNFQDAFKYNFQIKEGFEQYFLLMSDEHFDSRKCDRKLLKKHHDQAKKIGARIIKMGDVFDCMGGKYDKRTNKADLRPEYNTAQYFDSIVDDAYNFYKPYQHLIDMISDGNHELSVMQRHEINLLNRLSEKLNVARGKYNGYIKFTFEWKTGSRESFIMFYSHGSGGNAPVTKGAIQTARRQEFFIADIYVSGHNHNGFEMVRPRVEINQNGRIKVKQPKHVNLGTYKNEVMTGGWADTKGFAPEKMGAAWLHFYYKDRQMHFNIYDTEQ